MSDRLKNFPNKLEETILNNYTFGATMTIPLIDTFENGYTKNKTIKCKCI